jgi:hypothetical protein
MSNRIDNAFSPVSVPDSTRPFIGDDLSEKDLDDLYDYFVMGNRKLVAPVVSWYLDKPHQVINRLLSRLTRAEHRSES